jgi:YD repeat-containing protein
LTLVPNNAAPENNRLKQLTTGSSTFAYRYDDNGNITDETTSRHFEWDHRDQMRVFRTQPANGVPIVYAQYLYDAAGPRT